MVSLSEAVRILVEDIVNKILKDFELFQNNYFRNCLQVQLLILNRVYASAVKKKAGVLG